MGHTDIEEIKQHIWLSDINWNDLLMHKLKSPFMPKDGDNFDKRFCEGLDNIGEETLGRYNYYVKDDEYDSLFKGYTIINYTPSKDIINKLINNKESLLSESNLSTQMTKSSRDKNKVDIEDSKKKHNRKKHNDNITRIPSNYHAIFSKIPNKLSICGYINSVKFKQNNPINSTISQELLIGKQIPLNKDSSLLMNLNKSSSVKLLPKKKVFNSNLDSFRFNQNPFKPKLIEKGTMCSSSRGSSISNHLDLNQLKKLNSSKFFLNNTKSIKLAQGNKYQLLSHDLSHKSDIKQNKHLTLNIDDNNNNNKNAIFPSIDSISRKKSFRNIFKNKNQKTIALTNRNSSHKRTLSLNQNNYQMLKKKIIFKTNF